MPAAVALNQGAGLTLYSIGDPTAEEQLYLEYINRARANPPAEAERLRHTTDNDVATAIAYFGVDRDLMVQQISALSPVPPLSMNRRLTAAARLHSLDMLANNFQSHTGTGGTGPTTRVQAQGYSWSALGENVFAFATSVLDGHAGFEIDWGYGTGGMQSPPGHRVNIHNASYKEVGIGVVNGRNGFVGPQLVTQDFGNQFGLTPFITGVAFEDTNTNGSYDIGEGIAGISVSVSGSTFFAVTTNSGGYSVPAPGDGSYKVTFSADGVTLTQIVAVVSGGNNVKVDCVLHRSAPVVSLPSARIIGPPVLRGGRVLLNVITRAPSTNFQIQVAENPAGPWIVDETAVFEAAGSQLRATAAARAERKSFYRVLPR